MDGERTSWTTADVVRASSAVYGELRGFTRDDVKNFTRFDDAGQVGSLGQGPRGARGFDEDEVVAIVALVPWAAALGGVEGRLAWVSRCRQLLRKSPGPATALTIEIRPPRLGVPRDPTVSSGERLADVYPNAIHIDLGRVRQAVRVALRERG